MGFASLLILAVTSRLVPHPANFAAVGGLGLFASKKYSALIGAALVLLTMVITDLFLGFGRTTPYVYVGMLGYAAFGRLISNRLSYIYAPILGSIFFFLISNFGVWTGGWYPHTLSGLTACFIAALPFFQYTILSDLVFCLGAFAVVTIYEKYKGGVLWPRRLSKPILRKK